MTKRRTAAMLGGTPTSEDWLCIPQNPTNELRRLKKQIEAIKAGLEIRGRKHARCEGPDCINRLKGRPEKRFCSPKCRLAAYLEKQGAKSTLPEA